MSEFVFSAKTAAVLRDADRKIRARVGGSHHALYSYWRVTMAKICPVDSFYVGFYKENRTIVFPYNFDGHEYVYPDMHTYGENTLATYILTQKRPYRYADDQGELLHRGVSYGDETSISADSVAVPILQDGEVVGLASIQSYAAGTYQDEHVRAFEWTARSIATVLAREYEDDANREGLGGNLDGNLETPATIAEMIDTISMRLRSLKKGIDAVREVMPEEATAAEERMALLEHECEEIQTEVMEMLTRPAVDGNDLLRKLTHREREIALLMAEGMSNTEIAGQLHITELTVKTHVSRILAKFGVKQRSAVAAKLRPLR
ncbi:LuxR C-terminal-related transcriptional regulator [Actinomadura sp. DC4]|uniref:LuxR C-terminal-related transcriptional regulator n=1 Tax=Actinomadura sp. DC4 TaxID=3055069 RepID=UPI0025B0EEC9|nr:LuxR C-terminal-related transcriptional regulator [Actinomadura sp. DC4]MDN3355138.1 LuxR C-terminal-related transcriptional regulator [Actinomadura sp. DC4]